MTDRHESLRGGALNQSHPDIPSLASRIYDKDELNEAEMNFLAAVSKAGRDYIDSLNAAKRDSVRHPDTEVWEAIKFLAGRRRDDAYALALHELESADEEEIIQLEAAE